MATSENTQRDELARINEHLWLSDLRKNPGGEVRLISAEGKLISGTYAFQVTRSVDAMVGVVAKHRTIATIEELDTLADDTVIRDYDSFICERSGGYWYIPTDGCSYGDSEISLPAIVLWEPEAEAAA